MGKSIGETQGRWASLFRINQILLPVLTVALIGFGSWVVVSIHKNDMRSTIADMNSTRNGKLIEENQIKIDRNQDRIDKTIEVISTGLNELKMDVRVIKVEMQKP